MVWGNRGSLRGDRGGGEGWGGGGFFNEGTEDSDVTRKEENRLTLRALMCRRTRVSLNRSLLVVVLIYFRTNWHRYT